MSLIVTWWGHAAVTVELGGRRVLTDPLFTPRLVHLRRHGAAVPIDAATRADVVVVSHLHADHLHVPSLRRVTRSARIVVPRGAAALLQRIAPDLVGRIEEIGPGGCITSGNVTVRAVAAHHDGRRVPGSPYRAPALGYVVSSAQRSVWFAGDTGLFDEMSALGPFDTALVPVGGWGPTLGPEHLDPWQAAEAIRRVRARHAVPIHYGTYWPIGLRRVAPGVFRRRFHDPGHDFAAALDDVAGASAHVLLPGESVTLP